MRIGEASADSGVSAKMLRYDQQSAEVEEMTKSVEEHAKQ